MSSKFPRERRIIDAAPPPPSAGPPLFPTRRVSQAPDYIVEQPVLSKEFESWTRRRESQEDLASSSGGEKKEGDERNNDGEDGTQTEARSARKRSPAATPDRDVQRQSVEGQGVGDCDGEDDVSSDGDSENSDDTSSDDDGIGEGASNGGISDVDGDSDNDGNRSEHHATSQKRMARGARNVRSREPKPSVPRLQHIWDFLRTEKNWKYLKVRGDHMVARPDKDIVPMPQSQVRYLRLTGLQALSKFILDALKFLCAPYTCICNVPFGGGAGEG